MTDEEPKIGIEILAGIEQMMNKKKGTKISDHLGIKQDRFDAISREVFGVVFVDTERAALDKVFADIKDIEMRARILIYSRAMIERHKDCDECRR